MLILTAFLFLLNNFLLLTPFTSWLPSFIVTLLLSVGITAVVYALISAIQEQLDIKMNQVVAEETEELQATNERLRSIQELATTMRATLSFDRVVEQALDVCKQSLVNSGIPSTNWSAPYFYIAKAASILLKPAASSAETWTNGCLVKAALSPSRSTKRPSASLKNPSNDPELRHIVAFRQCQTAVSIPLRAGFNIFGGHGHRLQNPR
ncbi:MAG: hypothetical protein M5U34_18345 [Chloroflexi bacterium]|nr:hypothetical protein [Chloroflexota bacterium]